MPTHLLVITISRLRELVRAGTVAGWSACFRPRKKVVMSMAKPRPQQMNDHNDSSGRMEQAPLLPSIRQHLAGPHGASETIHHVLGTDGDINSVTRSSRFLRWFLPSKYGHYFVIILVSLDISCIFADFLVSLHVCEHRKQQGFNEEGWLTAEEVLGAFSLVFSTLFMVELLASLFAFGLRSVF